MNIPIIEKDKALDIFVSRLRRSANIGIWDGQRPTPYFDSCRHVHSILGIRAIFTRDTGHWPSFVGMVEEPGLRTLSAFVAIVLRSRSRAGFRIDAAR